ncbi:MAG: LysR family transcriptional regulator [Pseudomonadota bacterium]
MKKSDKDLQLSDFRALLAVIELGTVTRAAQRLDMSQSVLSYKLERMRKHFGDPLFVRVGNRMSPTPLVLQLAEPTAQVLRIIETDIKGQARFDPANSERVFRIGVNEVGAIALIPRLVQCLATDAPRARLTQLQLEPGVMAAALESGEMDLAAGHIPHADASLVRRLLYRRDYVCIASTNHPRVRRKISFKQLGEEPRLQNPGNPLTNAWLDEQMAHAGYAFASPTQTQHLAAVPFIVAASDLIAVVPREMFDLFRPSAAIKEVGLPARIPPVDVHQYWHPRMAGDPGHRFFRDFVYRLARE